MKSASFPPRQHPSAHNAPSHRRPSNHRAAPLTDDQYLARSLALVADLSRKVRAASSRHG